MVDAVPLVQVDTCADDVLHCKYLSVTSGRYWKVQVLMTMVDAVPLVHVGTCENDVLHCKHMSVRLEGIGKYRC